MGKTITKSFYDWCIENNKKDLLNRWDYELNEKSPREVGFNSKSFIYFKCPRNIHKSELHNLNSYTHFKCRQCGSFLQWCKDNNHQDYLDRWDYNLNNKTPEEVTASSNQIYWFKCKNDITHKSHYVRLNKLTTMKNGLTQCVQCVNFGKWCLDNHRQDLLDRWDFNLNKCNPFEIGYSVSKKVYFKCPLGIHKSSSYLLNNITNSKKVTPEVLCRDCNSFAQFLINTYGDNALKLYWDYGKNKVDPWKIYKSSSHKVWIFCQKKKYHESYIIMCRDFSEGDRCGYCHTGKTHKLDSVGYLFPNVFNMWSEKNHKSLYEISPQSNIVYIFNCEKHGEFKRTMQDMYTAEFRCPDCSRERDESFLQEKVRLYITEKYGYELNHERDCTIIPQNPQVKNKTGQLPFDNEIEELKLIIEVNGIQHYKICGFHQLSAKHNNTTPQQEFHYQRLKDRYKKYISYINGYQYLEIPYWTEKDETYKQLIDNKIEEILVKNKNK